MRYLLLVNGQMPVQLKTGELSYQQLEGGSVPETASAGVKSWFEGLAREKTFLATLRGVWGALAIDSWQHSAPQPSAADQSDAESIRSRPSSEDTLNVLTMRASTLASETHAQLILGEGTGPGGAHQLGIFVAANVPKATAASVMREYWRAVGPPFRPEEIELFKKKGPEITSEARTRGHRAATKQGETKSGPDELTESSVRLMKTFRLMDVPALEIAVYQILRETAKSEGFFDQSPESARASLASALTYGLMAAKDLVKSGLPPEATKMDRRIYEYRSQLLKGMHGLASPTGFQILVVRLMTAGEGEFEKSGRDPEALARSMTKYVLYALFCGPAGPPYPSIEESGILSDLSWVFGKSADGQSAETRPTSGIEWNESTRIKLMGASFSGLLERKIENSKVIFAIVDRSEEYAQFAYHDRVLYGEIGSREWTDQPHPLAAEAVANLAHLGFRGGGPRKNYSKDAIPADPVTLATLAEQLFQAAYAPPADFALDIQFAPPESMPRRGPERWDPTSADERSTILSPETLMPCPQCGTTCQVGIRGGGQLVINCPEHGVVIIALDDAEKSGWQPRNQMKPALRLRILEAAVRFFLVAPEEDDFLIVQSMSLPCNYVQLRYNDGTVWAEVCSREWNCPYCGNRPLKEEKEVRLSEMGFTGGGPQRNYESRHVSRQPRELVEVLQSLLMTAYDEPEDFAVAVYPKRRETLRFLLTAFAIKEGAV